MVQEKKLLPVYFFRGKNQTLFNISKAKDCYLAAFLGENSGGTSY